MNTALSLIPSEQRALDLLASIGKPAPEPDVLSTEKAAERADLRRTLWTLESMGLVQAEVRWSLTPAGERRAA